MSISLLGAEGLRAVVPRMRDLHEVGPVARADVGDRLGLAPRAFDVGDGVQRRGLAQRLAGVVLDADDARGMRIHDQPHRLARQLVGHLEDCNGRNTADLTFTVNSVLSPQFRKRRHQRALISRLNHKASISAAYASSSTLPYSHARLASGCWLGITGREFNPLDSDEGFLSNVSLGFPLS